MERNNMVWLVIWNDHNRQYIKVYAEEEGAMAFAKELVYYQKHPLICSKKVH